MQALSIDGRRQGGGLSSDTTPNFGFDNGDSTSGNVPDQWVKRIVNGQVVAFRFSYRDGRWVITGRKVLGNVSTTSTPTTSASDSRRRHRSRGFWHELKDDVERGARNGGKQIVRDGIGSIEDRLLGNSN